MWRQAILILRTSGGTRTRDEGMHSLVIAATAKIPSHFVHHPRLGLRRLGLILILKIIDRYAR